MDKQAADKFISWLSENSSSVVSVCAEMQSPEVGALPPQKKAAKLQKLFLSIEKEIGPRLAEIEEGLQFEVGPSQKKRHALIISAGGVSSLIEAVRYIADHAPDIADLEVIAFKPARPIPASAKQIVETKAGRKEVGPTDVLFSLTPELTKVGVTLYFKDYKEEEYQAWGQVGFNFMDFALGEYKVMESVGEIAFRAIADAQGETHPVTELAQHFETKRALGIKRYNELKQQPAEARYTASLEFLSGPIEKLNTALKEDEAAEEVFISATIWSENPKTAEALKSKLTGLDVESTPKISAVGNGYAIDISGAVPKAGFAPEKWLRSSIAPALSNDGFVTGIGEQEVPSPMMAQFVGASLLEQEKFDEAIRILKLVAARNRKNDDGTLHGLLGMAYLKAKKNEEAAKAYEIALSLATDKDVRGEVLTNRGSAFQRIGKLDEALASFEQALELDSGKYTRQYNVGQGYAQKGNVAKACEHLGKALELKPDLLDHIRSDADLEKIRSSEAYAQMIANAESKSGGIGKALKKGLKSIFS